MRGTGEEIYIWRGIYDYFGFPDGELIIIGYLQYRKISGITNTPGLVVQQFSVL